MIIAPSPASSTRSSYAAQLESSLGGRSGSGLSSVDLFCGCGGLSLGMEAAGIETRGYDASGDAIATCRLNLAGKAERVLIDTDFECPTAPVLVAGPPCQPFSALGLNRGRHDVRDGFPAFIRAVRSTKPQVWMFENVTGLVRQKAYIDEILAALRKCGYRAEVRVLNAVNYGVPQNRQRLVAVGWKKGRFEWPREQAVKTTVGDAIGRLMTRASATARWLTPSMEAYIARYERASNCAQPRDLLPHKPARTVTCRNLGGATGDMLRVRLPDGRRRMLTVKEAARLQSFPDSYRFAGSVSSQLQQIGNAVPPLLAWQLGRAVHNHLC